MGPYAEARDPAVVVEGAIFVAGDASGRRGRSTISTTTPWTSCPTRV